jgi:hypothetical protein
MPDETFTSRAHRDGYQSRIVARRRSGAALDARAILSVERKHAR